MTDGYMRVTVDVDGNELEALVKLLNIMYYTSMFPTRKIELYRTGRGYHIVVRDLPITFQQSLILRMTVGDDSERIWLDEQDDVKPKQVLFTWKHSRGFRQTLDVDRFIHGVHRKP